MKLPLIQLLPTRIALSLLIAAGVWAGVTTGLLSSTVVPLFDQQLRDSYLSLTVDSLADDAPGLLHLTFDNEALAAHDLPERVPAAAIRDMLAVARGTSQAIVLDIDLATRSDLRDFGPLAQYLIKWGEDENAALLVLARPQYEISYRDKVAFQIIDNIVQISPNIHWAGVGTFADADGVIRNYEFWSCVTEEIDRRVLASAAVYIWARNAAKDTADAMAMVESTFTGSDAYCAGEAVPVITMRSEAIAIPRQGLIEFQTSIDALNAGDGEQGQFAADGLPRLMSVGYCRINPESCGDLASPTKLANLTRNRIVLVSAANDFSRDEHMTPVGIMAGSVILGNAGRALINSGPPDTAPRLLQLLILLVAVGIIWAIWIGMDKVRTAIRAQEERPLLRKCLYGLANPGIVQWLAFAAANLMILFYYYLSFPSSGWDGLVGASFGTTTVAAIAAFHEWATKSWQQERLEE